MSRVSVIIPAHNASEYVGQAIQSALTQSYAPLEVIVVDDGSTDATPDIVAGFAAPVRLIRKPNGGPASARNVGARAAKGDWLAFLDSDDWWYPEKLSRQMALTDDASTGLIHSPADHRTDIPPPVLTFEALWQRNRINMSSVLIRRTAFESLGGFDEAKPLISVEDYHLWLRVAASEWRIVCCPDKLIHYTRGIGISSNADRFLQASLYNVDDIGARLSLPAGTIQRRRNDIVFEFANKALFERDVSRSRQLSRLALRGRLTGRNIVQCLLAHLPAPLLDGIRQTRRRIAVSRDSAATKLEVR